MLRPKTFCLALLYPLALASCDVPRDPNTVYTQTGEALGPRQRQEITISQSKVSFVGSDAAKKREAQNLKDRYIEFLTLQNNGSITYDKLFQGYYADYSNEDNLKGFVERLDILKKEATTLKDDDIKKAAWFVYATVSSPSYTCFLFAGHFGLGVGADRGEGYNESANGGACYNRGTKTPAAIETEMLEILSRIRFDGGALNRR